MILNSTFYIDGCNQLLRYGGAESSSSTELELLKRYEHACFEELNLILS